MNIKVISSKNIWVPGTLFWVLGFFALCIIWLRAKFQSYSRPRTFKVSDFERCIDYDYEVFKRYEKYIDLYDCSDIQISGSNILELGPGADLGIGMLALSNDAEGYFAIDVNPLAANTPRELYDSLANRFGLSKPFTDNFCNAISPDKDANLSDSNINYVIDSTFSISQFKNNKINIILSNHAFEHFNDINMVINESYKTLISGGIFMADIDLQTHTRWLRESDPLNIYRFSKPIWEFFLIGGSPNRITVSEYKLALENAGFEDIKISPRVQLDSKSLMRVWTGLDESFRKDEIANLDFVIIAKKP